jgi:Lrp/AsnC family leucine-responsive transcriptional regulator
LAEELGLTAPAIAQRVRRLEERGVISGFAVRVSAAALAPVCAFLFVEAEPSVIHRLQETDAVMEAHFLGGHGGWIVKVRCTSLADLDALVAGALPNAGLRVTEVRVALRTEKETGAIPLGGR